MMANRQKPNAVVETNTDTDTPEPPHAGVAVPETEIPTHAPAMRLASLVIFVSNLEASIAFYRELLDVEATIINDTAALLVGAGGNQIYLRSIGVRGSRPLGGLGLQYMLWSAGSEEEFLRCQEALRIGSPHVVTTQHQGFQMVEGRDPDDMPVLVSYPGPEQVPRREIISRIYEW
jgi:catechol 2,3-dioxygenase-like lactoylglutathione lyase family enzyme